MGLSRFLVAAALVAVASTAAAQQVVAVPPPPATTSEGGPTPQSAVVPLSSADGLAIVQAYRSAPEFRFPPPLLAAVSALSSPDPTARATASVIVAKAAEALARQEHGRLVDTEAADPNWALRAPYDPAKDFAKARAAGDIASWAQALPRRSQAYLALIAAWRTYDGVRIDGGWSTLPAGLTLHRGSRSKDVALLRARLAKEGYGAADLSDQSFDEALAAEVADFQRRHALTPTGEVTAATLAALNVPVEAREATIDANLERARWLPDQLPPNRIVADIAAAEVTLFTGGVPTLTMRAIVGSTKHLTPIFASNVTSIVFNPPWHVPSDIAKRELYPKEARSKGYFARNGFSVINGQLVQHAGPQSALGRVKFEIPNPFSIYLHDTPGRALFAVDSRGRSHGCVRLQKPRELALALLDAQGWTAQRIDAVIDKGDTKWAKLATPMPVFLVYRTAVASPGQPVTFRPDLYGWDKKLNATLLSAR